MMARHAIGYPTGTKSRIDQATAASQRAINEHTQLTAELAAIQEELERRVSLAKQRREPPWKSGKSSS